MNEEQTVLIKLEEYKELLIIKGKYEELKSWSIPHMYPTKITYTGDKIGGLEQPYTVSCATFTSTED